MTYLADVATLAAKDLRLELRSRDTVPAMLLFVVSTLVVFNFALPAGASAEAAYGLLWAALVFTAILGLTRAQKLAEWYIRFQSSAMFSILHAPLMCTGSLSPLRADSSST